MPPPRLSVRRIAPAAMPTAELAEAIFRILEYPGQLEEGPGAAAK
jgi:hypothetical protein